MLKKGQGLVISVTKEQYENLVIKVREIIQEIAESPILDELELPSQQAMQAWGQ